MYKHVVRSFISGSNQHRFIPCQFRERVWIDKKRELKWKCWIGFCLFYQCFSVIAPLYLDGMWTFQYPFCWKLIKDSPSIERVELLWMAWIHFRTGDFVRKYKVIFPCQSTLCLCKRLKRLIDYRDLKWIEVSNLMLKMIRQRLHRLIQSANDDPFYID